MGQLVKTESVQDGSDTITTIFTPKGNLTQRYRRTDITGYTVEFPCKNAEDVEKYMSIPYETSEPNVEQFFARREEIGDEALVMGSIGDAICLPATILSPIDMCLLWADEPDLMVQVIQTISERLTGEETPALVFHTAIGLEKDSVIFYLGIRDLVPAKLGKDRVNEVIAEEMRHITLLSRQLAAVS